LGDEHLLLGREGYARRLLAVAQGHVVHLHSVRVLQLLLHLGQEVEGRHAATLLVVRRAYRDAVGVFELTQLFTSSGVEWRVLPAAAPSPPGRLRFTPPRCGSSSRPKSGP